MPYTFCISHMATHILGKLDEMTGEMHYHNAAPLPSGKPHMLRVKAVSEEGDQVLIKRHVSVGESVNANCGFVY